MNKVICHMTAISNLENIILSDGLLCKNKMSENSVQYNDIANHDVQDKRSQTFVPFPPGGDLHSYVPFYFWGQTPMLLVNKSRQSDIVFIVTTTEVVMKAGLPFAFTDRHAVIKYAKFYNNLDELEKLDWGTIKLRY